MALASRGGGIDVHAGPRREHVGEDDAEHEGQGRDRLEIDQRLETDPADLAQVPRPDDAVHDDTEDQGRDRHLDQLDEPVAEGLQGDGEIRQCDAEDDPEDEGRDHLTEQGRKEAPHANLQPLLQAVRRSACPAPVHRKGRRCDSGTSGKSPGCGMLSPIAECSIVRPAPAVKYLFRRH